MPKEKPTGLTRDAGYQVGVRKTLAVAPEAAWEFLWSSQGRSLWLGEVEEGLLEKGTPFETTGGISGKIRVWKPFSHWRMAWKHPEWEHSSTLQVRLIPIGKKTTISFHQEKLSNGDQRSAMKAHWKAVLELLAKTLET